MPSAPTIPEKLRELESAVKAEVFERDRVIHTAVLALVSRLHHYQVGTPGIGKSYLVRRLIARIAGLEGEGYFQYLMTSYTTPEEIYGPPSLAALEQDIYRRNTHYKLPRASIAFLDEAFKGNSSILNALLTLINERLFMNGEDPIEVPLSCLFAASNEAPTDSELAAFWDRLHFRHEVERLHDAESFQAMLITPRVAEPAPIITWDEILTAQQEAAAIPVSVDVVEALYVLRENLRATGVEPTERRFTDCLRAIQAEAYLNEHPIMEIGDMRPLRDMLWDRLESQRVTERCVLELTSPIDKEAHDLIDRIDALHKQLDKAAADSDNDRAVAKVAVEIYQKLQRVKKKMDNLTERATSSGRQSDTLELLDKRFQRISYALYTKGFKMPGDDIEVPSGEGDAA